MLDSISLSSVLKFQQEDFSCFKHKLPKGAICRSEVCGDRLLCLECIKEHDETHLQDISQDDEFFKSQMNDSVKQLAKQCLITLEKHESKKIETRNLFRLKFERARQQFLKSFDLLENQVFSIVDKSSIIGSNENEEKSLEKCKLELELLLDHESKIFDEEEEDLRSRLANIASIMETANKLKENHEMEITQAIENHSSNLMSIMCQELKDLKTSLHDDLNKPKLSHLGSLLKAEAKAIRRFDKKVAGLSYSEKDQSLMVLEGYDKLNSFQNLFDLSNLDSRVDFDKFEDNVTKVKCIQKDSYLLCNNTNKWIKVHHPSKICCEFSEEGPIQKLDYCEESKLIIVTTDNSALCYQDGNPRIPLYHKILARTALTDSCLINQKGWPLLALSHRTGMITVYDISRKKERFVFKGHTSAVASLTYWSSKKLLITTGQAGEAKIWKFTGSQMKCLQTLATNGPLTNFVLIEKKNWIVFVSDQKNMAIYDCVSNKKLGMRKFDSKIVNPCFLKNSGKLVFGMEKNLYEIQM